MHSHTETHTHTDTPTYADTPTHADTPAQAETHTPLASLQETLEMLKSLHMVKATRLVMNAIDNFIKKSNELKTPLNEIKDDLNAMNILLSKSELWWSLNRADELTSSLPDHAKEVHVHAFMSWKDAEKMLLQDGLRAGTFLIRQSESQPDKYSLSVRDAASAVHHYHICSSKSKHIRADASVVSSTCT